MLRVGVTSRFVWARAGTAAGSLLMMRKALPSTRTRLERRWGFPVQWTVSASARWSAGDQMLKYGSQATSGTDGGRSRFAVGALSTEVQWERRPAPSSAARQTSEEFCFGFIERPESLRPDLSQQSPTRLQDGRCRHC